ncbi:MAG: helix-turn-helix domain-containing protein [Candidatus Gastranaerophilales bacterium]|nr:helix-turn-helix domain-containing protein [Candidatus Gastranaerophilales bacterium]
MRLLTIDDVAGLLKISKSTLYRWVNKREIPFVKLGGKLRFNEDEIKTFVLQNSVSVSD